MFNARFFKWFAFAALALGSSHSAWAAGLTCDQPAINVNDGKPYYTAVVNGVNPPSFDPNAYAIGARIGNKMTGNVRITNSTGLPQFKCATSGLFTAMGQGIGVPVNNVYPTSVPGVGIRLSTALGVWPASVGSIGEAGSTWLQSFLISIELIKTDEITQAGILAGPFGAYHHNLDGQIMVLFSWEQPVPIKPIVPACTVVTPNIKVPLGSIAATVFQGPGSTSPATDFGIDLACSGGSSGTHTVAYVTLTDSTNAGNVTTTLPLSTAAGSTAQGVGVQVLNNGTPVAFGPDSATLGNTNQWQAGSINQGVSTFHIPLQAQYIQTGAMVTAGVANAVATFTMAYQ
jgi:type 1 fimbria pilin